MKRPLKIWLENKLKDDEVRSHLTSKGIDPHEVMKLDPMIILMIIQIIVKFLASRRKFAVVDQRCECRSRALDGLTAAMEAMCEQAIVDY